MKTSAWHAQSSDAVLSAFGTTIHGLPSADVSERLAQYGRNELIREKGPTALAVFFRQFKSPLIGILFVAAFLAFLLHETVDGVLIIIILSFNATIGFVQERRADAAINALQKLVSAVTVVIREGISQIVPQEEVVPGDVLVLETGDIIACDARVIAQTNLKVNESILTGEAVPVNKQIRKLSVKTALPDRVNMVYRGTTVAYGRGRAVVTATGMHTRYGSIVADVARGTHEETPIQHRLTRLSQSIGIAVVGLVCIVIALGVFRQIPFLDMALVGISLAVSVIPEGLPIVVTITLAVGMWRMARRNAIVRKLPAVETLGSVNIIASDKTGTLTYGEMMAQQVFVNMQTYAISGRGYQSSGSITRAGKRIVPAKEKDLLFALRIGMLCNNASIRFPADTAESQSPQIIGDPTELALVVAGRKAGLEEIELAKTHHRIGEVPFDFDKKYMTTVHEHGAMHLVAVKGAPEQILAMSSRISVNGKVRRMNATDRKIIAAEYAQMAHTALRGMALAYMVSTDGMADAARIAKTRRLIFLGLVGIRDAVREEAAETLALAARAGIRTIMVTGDHHDTAVAIAKELGILDDTLSAEDEARNVVEGVVLDTLSDEELRKRLPNIRVAARVSPEHKLRIVRAAKQTGNVVAVTGDGVNDAPALVEADIGIAVDEKSTDAAKGAADILLTDGNFATILAAVEEGRTIFANIRRVTLYLLSTNVVEAILILVALVTGMPLPLLPIQILWLNVVTDTFLDISIGAEPKHASLMQDGPNPRTTRILNRFTLGRLLYLASILVLIVFAIYHRTLGITLDMRYVYSMTLTALAVSQWFNSFNVRSGRESLFRVGILRNPFHLAALGLVLTLHLSVLYIPPITKAMHLVPLAWSDWVLIVGFGSIVLLLEELRKLIFRHWRKAAKAVHLPAIPVDAAH